MAPSLKTFAVQRANAQDKECERDLDSKLQRLLGPLNTRQPHSLRGAVSLAIAPQSANRRAGDLISNPARRTAPESYLSPSVLVGGVMLSPKKQLRRATVRRGASDWTVPSLGSRRNLLKRAGQIGLMLAGSRSSRIVRKLNHRHPVGQRNSTNRQIRIPHDRYAGGLRFEPPLTSLRLCAAGLGGLCKAVSFSLNPVVVKDMTELSIYFDGGVGRERYGSYEVREGDAVILEARRLEFGPGTSNEAEYLALKAALRHLLEELGGGMVAKDVTLSIFSDSSLVVNQVNGRWKTKNTRMAKLSVEVRELLDQFLAWQLNWNSRVVNVAKFGH